MMGFHPKIPSFAQCVEFPPEVSSGVAEETRRGRGERGSISVLSSWR